MVFDAESLAMVDGGYWEISYQKRVIDASMWVNEAVSEEVVEWIEEDSTGFLPTPSVFVLFIAFALLQLEREIADLNHNLDFCNQRFIIRRLIFLSNYLYIITK